MFMLLSYLHYQCWVSWYADPFDRANPKTGRLVGMIEKPDLQGNTIEEVYAAFRAWCDQYEVECLQAGVAPRRPFKRIEPISLSVTTWKRVEGLAQLQVRPLDEYVGDAVEIMFSIEAALERRRKLTS